MWIEAVVLLAQLSAQSQPQSQPTEPPSREALAQILAKSHHRGAKLPEMVSFTATLKVAAMGRNNESIEVTLASWFRKDVPRGSRRPMSMIRYSLDEGGKRLERGRDAYGYWYRSEGKVTPCDDADGTTDRELVRQQISLAQQLLSVVNPADVLHKLTGNVKVTEGKLPFGKAKDRYWIASGEFRDYPFYTFPQEKGKQREASLCLYVDKATGMLKAVQATHSASGNQELVLFREFGRYPLTGEDQTNVSLPTVLGIYRAQGKKYEPLVKIAIDGVSLNPKLTAADFQRQR